MVLNEMWCSEAYKDVTPCRLGLTVVMITYLLPVMFLVGVALVGTSFAKPRGLRRSKLALTLVLLVTTVLPHTARPRAARSAKAASQS